MTPNAQATASNVALLMQGGLTRTEANLVVDMTAHFEEQLDELVMRTITTLVAAAPNHTALAGAVVFGITLKRKGDTVKSAVMGLFEGKL